MDDRTKMEEVDDLAGACALLVGIVRENPRAAYLAALGLIRAVERMAAGRPIFRGNATPNELIDHLADGYLELLPGLKLADDPTAPAAAKTDPNLN